MFTAVKVGDELYSLEQGKVVISGTFLDYFEADDGDGNTLEYNMAGHSIVVRFSGEHEHVSAEKMIFFSKPEVIEAVRMMNKIITGYMNVYPAIGAGTLFAAGVAIYKNEASADDSAGVNRVGAAVKVEIVTAVPYDAELLAGDGKPVAEGAGRTEEDEDCGERFFKGLFDLRWGCE